MNKENRIGRYKNHILLGICGLLAIANVIMTIDSSATGIEVSDLRSRENALAEQKRSLQDELVRSLSVSELQEKGGELGFTKPGDVVYLSAGAPVAKLP